MNSACATVRFIFCGTAIRTLASVSTLRSQRLSQPALSTFCTSQTTHTGSEQTATCDRDPGTGQIRRFEGHLIIPGVQAPREAADAFLHHVLADSAADAVELKLI